MGGGSVCVRGTAGVLYGGTKCVRGVMPGWGQKRDPRDGGLLSARGTDRHQVVETAEELLSYPRPLRVCCCARRGTGGVGQVV